jgi:hypothetical protein
MTEDSVMLSLRELHALEERRLFEEEEQSRREARARREAIARAEEAAAREAERLRQEAAEAQAERERAEHDRCIRDEAIREAALLRARLEAEAAVSAAERERRARLEAEAVAPSRAEPTGEARRASSRLGAVLVVGLALVSVGAGSGVVALARRLERAEAALVVQTGATADERTTNGRLGAELVAKADENRALAAALAEATQRRAPATTPDHPAVAGQPMRVERSTKPPVTPPLAGASGGTCDRLDPLCGFSR